ncbi:MAG: HAD-IA family hydrolase [Cohaesibacter sp.]|nr:HAD-IA family hydrolase [Cohaesibacter sp.]MCV6600393.1 HAD-IA family hydrolase [Cohaesibacter sp.]
MTPKLFVFDCDGTIVDSQHTIVESMHHAFQVNDLTPPSQEQTRSIIGLSLAPAVAKLDHSLSDEMIDRVVEDYKSYCIAKRETGEDDEALYDGAKQVIESLAGEEDVLLGIATGKAYRGVVHLFNCHDWHNHFVTVQTADRAPSKPHPGMILQAMDETGAARAATVMIGDTSYDMEMAVNAGVMPIGVSWGYHSKDILHAAGAKHIVDDYFALHELLKTL